MKYEKAFAAILIMSLIAVIVGGVMILLGIFVTATISNSANSTITPASASGTVAFSPGKNVSCGETFVITDGGTSRYIFNITDQACPALGASGAGVTQINLSGVNAPKSYFAMTNFTASLNSNGTFSAVMLATNGSDGNTTTIQWKTTGAQGNTVSMTTTMLNVTLSGSKLTGGVDGSTTYSNTLSTSSTNVSTAFLLLGIILIVGGAIGIISVLTGFTQPQTRG